MQFIKVMSLSALLVVVAACSSEPEVEVIDLDKVLDVTMNTMDQVQARTVAPVAGQPVDEAAKQKHLDEFNTQLTQNLNAAKIYSQPLATEVKRDGSFEGFVDTNQNLKEDMGEAKLFIVEVDNERNRLIATDTQQGYRRDHGFSMGGLATGLLIGHLLSRQSAAGVQPSKFANAQMSPKGYHAAAVSSAKARAGSGSFKSGK
jgi:hypothetical protein